MSAKPLLSDLRAANTRYEAGDKIVARVRTQLSNEQAGRLTRAVIKFAGADVSVLIVNTSDFSIGLERAGETGLAVAKAEAPTEESKLGLANIDLAKLVLQPGDRLIITDLIGRGYGRNYARYVKEWAGQDVEVILV